jgi:hypothetical protein
MKKTNKKQAPLNLAVQSAMLAYNKQVPQAKKSKAKSTKVRGY